MKSPSYRIVTICPAGMSEQLSAYLNKPVAGAEPLKTKDAIAIDLTSPYSDRDLPFAGTVLAWAQADVMSGDDLGGWLNCLDELKTSECGEAVSLEAFLTNVNSGSIALACFYPPSEAGRQASLLMRSELRDELFNRFYQNILANALLTDAAGVMIAVIAEEEGVAESLVNEAISLLTPSDNSTNS